MHRQQQVPSKTTLSPRDETAVASATLLQAVMNTELLGDMLLGLWAEITALQGVSNWGKLLCPTSRLCLHFPAEAPGAGHR